MKNKILVLILSLSSIACSSKGIDGSYNRIDQTAFEKAQGMSSELVISNNGENVVLKNSWGDTPLRVVKKDNQVVIQYENQDAYFLNKKDEFVTLTDVNNLDQTYTFKED